MHGDLQEMKLTSSMKIAVLTSGILPVPAVQGGAVENLIDFYLEYNDQHKLHDITVYSVWHPGVERHPALQSEVNHYHFIDVNSFRAKVRKRILHWLCKRKEYYHYTIEYYLHVVIKDICKKKYDLILLENRPGYALRLKDLVNAKLVYHLHNEKLDNKAKDHKLIYDAASRIITVSDYIANQVRTINGDDNKCKTVHNGIDLEAFSQSADYDFTMPFTKNDFVLVFSGRVNPEKGILELIDAMKQLDKFPQIKLLIIGSCFYGNADNENEFSRMLKEKAAHLQDRIIFTGFVPYSKMPKYLKAADIAIIPSVWDDPFPTTILEAQAMGLPIITTRRGGIPEEVSEEFAIILDTNQELVPNLAQAILDLYQHPEKRESMSKAALAHATYFNKERYAKDFFDAISSF